MKTILFLLLLTSCAYAHIPEDKAVLAIIGEAEGEGYSGLLAVACSLRNRDSLKGVYGLSSPRVKKSLYSREVFLLAQKAWRESALKDVTNGSTGWGNSKDVNEFRNCAWWRKCTIVYRHKNHFFYKENV